MDFISYLCIMRYIIILLLSGSLYGQTNTITPHEHRMDSIAIYRLCQTFSPVPKSISYIHRLKLSFKTRINIEDLSNFNIDANTFYDIFNDVTTDDYLSVFKYDLRGKYYINKNVRITSRMVIMGTKYEMNQYSLGLMIKF